MDINDPTTNPLLALRDIHMPTPISNFPTAPGFIILAMLVILTSIGLIIFIYHNQSVWHARKQALSLLKQYQQKYPKQLNSQKACSLVNELLKKVAFFYYPRTAIASLKGRAWLNFLNKTISNPTKLQKLTSKFLQQPKPIPCFDKVQKELLEFPYHGPKSADLDLLFTTAEFWIKNQRRLSSKAREALCSN